MKGILPEELVVEMLKETGAYGPAQSTHFVRSVQSFRPLRIQKKNSTETSLAIFDEVFKKTSEYFSGEFSKSIIDGPSFMAALTVLQPLRRSRLREESYVVSFKCVEAREPVFVFISRKFLFATLNTYMGGGSSANDKADDSLTTVEKKFFEKIAVLLMQAAQKAFTSFGKIAFFVDKVNVSISEQAEYLKMDFLCAEFSATADESCLGISLPPSFVKQIQKIADKNSEKQSSNLDPTWRQVVTETVLATDVELNIGMGEFTIPFAKSLNFALGDVFEWAKYGPQVEVSFLDKPRLLATIGAVGDNYAIRVDRLID